MLESQESLDEDVCIINGFNSSSSKIQEHELSSAGENVQALDPSLGSQSLPKSDVPLKIQEPLLVPYSSSAASADNSETSDNMQTDDSHLTPGQHTSLNNTHAGMRRVTRGCFTNLNKQQC